MNLAPPPLRADHPDIGDGLTMDDLARLPWVVYQRPYDAPAARQLGMLGLEPHVEVSVPSFQLLPSLVAGTRRIALIQRRLAELLAPIADVRVLPCPFEAVPVQEALWWHPVHTQDAAHTGSARPPRASPPTFPPSPRTRKTPPRPASDTMPRGRAGAGPSTIDVVNPLRGRGHW